MGPRIPPCVLCGTAYCVRHGSTAKHSRVRTQLMLRTIPGFGNRGSSARYRPVRREPALGLSSPRSRDQAVRAESGGWRHRRQAQQSVAGAAVEVSGNDTLRNVNGLGRVASWGAGTYRDVRRTSPPVVAAVLQQIVAEQSCRADPETQRRRQADIGLRHLGGPFVRGAERHKDGAVKRADRIAGLCKWTSLGLRSVTGPSSASSGLGTADRLPARPGRPHLR